MKTRDYVTVAETRQALRAIYQADTEVNLKTALLRTFEDGLEPVDGKGRWRPSRPLVLACSVLCAVIGVFAYFSLGGGR